MKKMLLVLSLVIFSIMFVGCGKKEVEKEEGIVIAGIYKAGDQVWFIDEGAAAKKKALEMGAKDFLFIDAKMNPDTYLMALDNVIAQEVDGVVVCVPDQKLSQITVEKLQEANIPVIAADDPLQDESGEKIAPWVGINAYKIGETNGEWMANYAKENGLDKDPETGVIILTMDTVSSCVPRTEGEYDKFTAMLPDFPKSKIWKSDYNGETDKGYNAAAAVITAHPEIKNWLVMSGNEEGAVGAVRALEQAGLDKSSAVIGLGAYLAKGEFKKDYSAMKAATYFSADAVGGDSVEFLMNYIKDKTPIPMEHAVDAAIVTKENYREIMGKNAD